MPEAKPNGAGNGPAPVASPLRGTALEGYHGQRLVYRTEQQGVEDFDPLTWTFVKAMFKEWLILSFISGMAALFLALPLGFAAVVVLGQDAGQPIFALWGIAGFLVWVVFLFRAIPVQLSEWKFLVDDRGAAATSAFEHITWAFRRRRSPIRSLRVRRVSQALQADRDYLEVREGVFSGYVSCFAYGGDLYIGWTFWWRLSPFRWVLIALGRVWQMVTFRASQLHIMARYEGAKALREALHAAAREGVDVACGSLPAQGSGTIGSEVPIERVGSPSELPDFIARSESGVAG